MKKIIQWAPREKRRQVNEAVGRSFLKTITEPMTNSDSILKKQAGVPHATGLIDELLKLNAGDKVNTADVKGRLKKGEVRKIKVALYTAGPKNRLCQVTDAGTGMSYAELEEKFGTYASAKAKGEKTRSLFGRGAVDVMLYHEDFVIYSVKDGALSRCKIYWADDTIVEVDKLGHATKAMLRKHHLPLDILHHGTVVQFVLKEGTRIPYEDQILSKMSSFYMLRLIAADPNTEVEVRRSRADGPHVGNLEYDFPLGEVIGRFDDTLDLGKEGKLPVAILVARSDVALETDPQHIERRENGLLFVDDNDAVLDLTLLPDFERTPYLAHIFGIVRVTGLRQVLETHLEAKKDAEAVLTTTRDGFDRRNELTKSLFALVERHVKPLYEAEEQRERKGNSKRSEALDQRINDALKAINKFNSDETEEEGDGDKPVPPRPEAIYFSVVSTRLHAGAPRRVSAFINHEKINDGEIVLFESDHDDIKVEPDSTVAKASKKQPHQVVHLSISCDVKGLKGKITALSLDKDGKEVRAELRILAVEDPPIIELPEDIAFTAPRYNGDPNRPRNNAALLVNLERFSGLPTITFVLDDVVGKVTLGEGRGAIDVKVTQQNVITGHKMARVSSRSAAPAGAKTQCFAPASNVPMERTPKPSAN